MRDARRFDDLFVAIMPALRIRVAAVGGDPWDAEDVVHDLYVKLRSSAAVRRTVLDHPNPVGYLHRAAINLMHDKWRAEGRRQRLLERLLAQAEASWDGEVGRCDDYLEISAALRALSSAERAAVMLVDVQGQTLDAAAGFLGVHRGTVHRNRQRAHQRLREAIDR